MSFSAKILPEKDIEPPEIHGFFVRTAKVKQNIKLTNFLNANKQGYLVVFQWLRRCQRIAKLTNKLVTHGTLRALHPLRGILPGR